MNPKVFTVQEATKTLPLVRQITFDIMAYWEQIVIRRTELDTKQKAGDKPEKIQELKDHCNFLIDKINGYIKEIEDLGGFVEEFRRGIINFPAHYHGRRVFLCWHKEDETVNHWHELDETFKDRVRVRDAREFGILS